MNRFIKYLYQNDKNEQQASELGPGSFFSINGTKSIELNKGDDISIDLITRRLKVNKLNDWNLCQDKTCFLQPSYTLVDHKNENIPKLSFEKM